MGFNLKEKLQNANKKNVAIVVLILLVILICAVGGFEYYQYQQFKVEKAKQENYMPVDLSGEPKKPSEYAVGMDYNQAVKSKKPMLVLLNLCLYTKHWQKNTRMISNLQK